MGRLSTTECTYLPTLVNAFTTPKSMRVVLLYP